MLPLTFEILVLYTYEVSKVENWVKVTSMNQIYLFAKVKFSYPVCVKVNFTLQRLYG